MSWEDDDGSTSRIRVTGLSNITPGGHAKIRVKNTYYADNKEYFTTYIYRDAIENDYKYRFSGDGSKSTYHNGDSATHLDKIDPDYPWLQERVLNV